MKEILVIALIAAIGYFSWKFNKSKRDKMAANAKLYKATIKPSNAVKSAKEINDDLAMEAEMKRVNNVLNKAKKDSNPMSFIKYEDESKTKN